MVKLNKANLRGNLGQSARDTEHEKIFFQQDNEPKHTAKATPKLLKRQQGECSGVAESKPRHQSNKELVAGLKRGCSYPIPVQPHRAWAVKFLCLDVQA